jgi:hypothetical protein
MSKEEYNKSKRIIMRGLLCLIGGSALLFVVKLPGLPELLGTLSSVAGSCILLYGNGCIIYGLLIFTRIKEPE